VPYYAKLQLPSRAIKLVLNRYICKNFAMSREEEKAFYDRLKNELQESTDWPADYLYKFIVPTLEGDKLKAIQRIFDNTGAVIESRKSRKGKYTSLSIMVNLPDPEAVIVKYKAVSRIEGVISL